MAAPRQVVMFQVGPQGSPHSYQGHEKLVNWWGCPFISQQMHIKQPEPSHLSPSCAECALPQSFFGDSSRRMSEALPARFTRFTCALSEGIYTLCLPLLQLHVLCILILIWLQPTEYLARESSWLFKVTHGAWFHPTAGWLNWSNIWSSKVKKGDIPDWRTFGGISSDPWPFRCSGHESYTSTDKNM